MTRVKVGYLSQRGVLHGLPILQMRFDAVFKNISLMTTNIDKGNKTACGENTAFIGPAICVLMMLITV